MDINIGRFLWTSEEKNLVPEDLKDLDTFKILTVRKICLDVPRGVALVLVNFAKNNQFGQKQLIVPLIKNDCQALDPVYHLNLLFSRTDAPPDSPAFSFRKKGRLCSVSYRSITARLKSLLSSAGLSPEKYSGTA